LCQNLINNNNTIAQLRKMMEFSSFSTFLQLNLLEPEYANSEIQVQKVCGSIPGQVRSVQRLNNRQLLLYWLTFTSSGLEQDC